jgi:Trk K+ transport system NAD-binding subunit
MGRARPRWRAQGRYLRALATRFRLTLALAGVLFVVAPLVVVWVYPLPQGGHVSVGAALHHVYFLLFGNPSLPYVDHWGIELVNVSVPMLGIAVLVDGLIRFGYLFFAKQENDKEWIAVVSQTLDGHVIVCGAGRIGYRVATELTALNRELVVVDKRDDAAFVAVLRDLDVPVLIDDIQSPKALERCNVARAEAIVCATDDDLANLNVALDARRANPKIRVVLRLFDSDLAAKVRESFAAEALSSSGLAAPAMALAAVDPRIQHSFRVGEHLMVVSRFDAGAALAGQQVSTLRDRFGALTLALRRADAPEKLHPEGATSIQPGDALTIQASYTDYVALRRFTGESEPPAFAGAPMHAPGGGKSR